MNFIRLDKEERFPELDVYLTKNKEGTYSLRFISSNSAYCFPELQAKHLRELGRWLQVNAT